MNELLSKVKRSGLILLIITFMLVSIAPSQVIAKSKGYTIIKGTKHKCTVDNKKNHKVKSTKQVIDYGSNLVYKFTTYSYKGWTPAGFASPSWIVMDKGGTIGYVANKKNTIDVSLGVSFYGVGVSIPIPLGTTKKGSSDAFVTYKVPKKGNYAFYSQKYIKGTYTVRQTKKLNPTTGKPEGSWSKPRYVKKSAEYYGKGAITNPFLVKKN